MRTAASRLFSSYARALWAAAAAAAVLLAFALLFNAGGDDGASDRREAVARYLGEINTTQQLVVEELDDVSRAYRKLSLTPAELKEVQGAEETLVSFRGQIAEVDAPPDATTLRTELLKLLDLEIAFAQEVVELVRYLPVEVQSGRTLVAATKLLRTELLKAKTGSAQQQAFVRYATAVRSALGKLAAATAPPVLELSHQREVDRLEQLIALSDRLGRAFAEQRAQEVDRLFRLFAGTTSASGATAQERQAVIAFNRRRRAIDEQLLVVATERTRLDKTLR